jgi:hypothetical protein
VIQTTPMYTSSTWILRVFSTISKRREISREKAGVHAGYSETARMLTDYADLVDMEMAEEGMTIEEFYEEERIPQSQLESFTHGVRAQVTNGYPW